MMSLQIESQTIILKTEICHETNKKIPVFREIFTLDFLTICLLLLFFLFLIAGAAIASSTAGGCGGWYAGWRARAPPPAPATTFHANTLARLYGEHAPLATPAIPREPGRPART